MARRTLVHLGPPLTMAACLGWGVAGAALSWTASGCGGDAAAGVDSESTPASAPAAPTTYDPRESLAPMIAAVGPAVVAVDARGGRPDPWRRAFPGADEAPVQGRGSGFIVDAEGLVVTNHHVIAGAQTVQVRLSDRRRFDARVVGSDPATDLALLRLEGLEGAETLPTVTLGHSAGLQVGDWVVAVGNPMGLEHSATVGILSGKGRGSMGLYRDSYIDFLQTDADIAPGSSGGPLFDLRGEVIGINTAVGEGLRPGFAIPVDQARQIIEQLRDHGEVVRGWLGASNDPAASGPGAAIGTVYEHTPAERAGLRPGDVIEQLDGEDLEDFEALRARVGTMRPGQEVELRVRRGDDRLTVRATLDALPEQAARQDLRPSRGIDAPSPKSGVPKWRLPFGLDGSLDGDAPESDAPAEREGSPARLGISARSVAGGLEVVEVRPGSLAQTLGLRPGDLLRELDGQVLRDPSDVARALGSAGSRIELRFEREGATHVVTLDR